MGSEGFQITIPDFDEEEYSSTPIPFGRTAGNGFGNGGGGGFGSGGFGGGSGSGQDSPTSTPLASAERADRSYFHSRGDSVNSVDSANSGHHSVNHSMSTSRYPGSKSFAHSSQTSVATPTTSPFSKKPSFASIRNAFKSGKATAEAPPVPQIDHNQVYPVLKNPFNRSTSSLATAVPAPATRKGSVVVSPPQHQRPTTPASTRAPKSRNHSYAKSQHSQSGSIFHTSENGSDLGHGNPFSSSPPPVPRMPGAFGGGYQSETPTSADFEDKVVMDPRTPAEYALHAVFMRFATAAEAKIDKFLQQPLDREPLLPEHMGPGVDPKFDELLLSLGKIAQKSTKSVVDSVMRWRNLQFDSVPANIIRAHTTQSPGLNRSISGNRPPDASYVLNERKSLTAIYITCRTLISVLQSIGKDALGESMGGHLEDTTFKQFKEPDLKLLTQSANHRINAELYATLLGHIASIRFVSVTDRFLAELSPVALGQVPKDLDAKYENLVKGLRHVQMKVWPPEAFEEAAEFIEALSKSFEHAHGLRLKIAFAETLVHLLHPIGKTAQAEVNHPQWAKAIEIIYPRAKDMMSKPRYWPVAYPLAITSLCVAPHQFFLKHWVALFEAGHSKLKEKPYRIPVMNGMMHLLWTYLYRCQEPASTTTSKLDSMMRHFFPANRLTITPSDEHLEPFIFMTHFILSRHVEHGRDFCLELLQEATIRATMSTSIANVIGPERITVSIQAILLSLHGIEREEPTPVWPSGTDFTAVPTWEDYPSSSNFLPAACLSKPGMQEFFDRCGSSLAAIASACAKTVGQMSVFDEQWSLARFNPPHEDMKDVNMVIRRHPEGAVAFPINSQITLLLTCFKSWPRLLHSKLPLPEAIDMLVRGVVHVEPLVGDAASAALKRFMAEAEHASAVLTRFTTFLFEATHVAREGSGVRLVVESPRLLTLWVSLMDGWIHAITQRARSTLSPEEEALIVARIDEIESGALFLLSHNAWSIHYIGVKVTRMLGILVDYLFPQMPSPDLTIRAIRVVDLLHGKELDKSYLHGFDELLEKPELDRLVQWRESTRVDIPLRLADSDNEKDRKLWRFVFPVFMQSCMDYSINSLTAYRSSLVAAANRYHPFISHIAGLSSRVPHGLATRTSPLGSKDGHALFKENKHLVDQWHSWVKILCCMSSLSETRPALAQISRDHTRAPSDPSFEKERLTTTRGLFRYLTPFLDSEYTSFRDAAVLCISCFPTSAYPQLLEDLNMLASRQFYDDPRTKGSGGGPPVIERARRQERLHSAVARTYYLTAPQLQYQRSAARQAALAHVLKFVRITQTYLSSPDMREGYSLQKLRRYFCGTVERLFDGLATLNDSDRFIPRNMHLALYRMCEEWCQLGAQSASVKQRLILMQRSVAAATNDTQGAESSMEVFRQETRALSNAAIGALASLCRKAYFPPEELTSGSPIERSFVDYIRPLDAVTILDRIGAILSSPNATVEEHGKKALRSLLAVHAQDAFLMDEALVRAYVSTSNEDGSSSFFSVVAEVICKIDNHGFTFSQVVCLGLSNLCNQNHDTRRHAFDILETIHEQSAGILTMSHFEGAIGSSAPGTHIHAHRAISDCLAGEHPDQAESILIQFSSWLTRFPNTASDRLPLLLLQSLEGWASSINLITNDRASLSPMGLSALYHLVSLTMRYARSHSEQILVLWSRLVDSPNQANGHATVRFLLEQSHKVGSAVFTDCAASIIACLSQTIIGRQIFQDLCSVIEPARMLPAIEHKLALPNAEDVELWSDLDALFAEQPHMPLGAAQFAFLFLADVALEHQWELQGQLPILLHAVFAHLDHKMPFVRNQARRMLFQLLRSWIPGYDELPERSRYPSHSALKSTITELEQNAESIFWKEEEENTQIEPKMQRLCTNVLALLEPLAPHLAEDWGSVALLWGTNCSIRAIAFRSLQIFRALMPPVTKADLSQLLARLSNTIAAPDSSLQSFTAEIILTLIALAESADLDHSLLPLLFWTTCACLSTTVESEFAQILELLKAVLSKIDLDDYHTSELLLSQRPPDWIGSTSLQKSLLPGLRSCNTSGTTFTVLQILARTDDPALIDNSDGRVRDLYTATLPWCLHAMTADSQDEELQELATNIAHLAEIEGRSSISRIMTSFVKSRFRTKDDFLRQSVISLREHYGADYWTDVVTLLMGLVLNSQRWLQVQSLNILKVLFQQRETRNPVELLGSELLMPLLRLLESDLATQALDVLEEPMTISGGPAAKHVLRMSMHMDALSGTESVADVFGRPEDSGWCVPRPDVVRQTCRSNLMAVFDTCKMPSRPSYIEFQPETETDAMSITIDDDLGGLVQNLHELTTFFSNPVNEKQRPQHGTPSHQLEARVAAILAKSTEPAIADMPYTPFVDVFRVGAMATSDDEDEDDSSSSESEMDAFIFDSPEIYRSAPNGLRLQ